jgi:osmotically-inducible protein OsmY
MSNDDLFKNVKDELEWDPKLKNASIAVAVDDGVVTLRGNVGTFREKREARAAVSKIQGVKQVDDELQVRLPGLKPRGDVELRTDVLQALMLDSHVPETIDVSVNDGYVTLSGTAEWKYERDEAAFVASNVKGVVGIWDNVELTGAPPSTDGVEHSIAKAMERNAKLDAKDIEVETADRTVTLKGTVRSWAEHDEAIDAAWAAPGVLEVKDHLLVSY